MSPFLVLVIANFTDAKLTDLISLALTFSFCPSGISHICNGTRYKAPANWSDRIADGFGVGHNRGKFMPERKGGTHYSGSRYRGCGICNDPNIRFIPSKELCEAHGVTTDQARTLFKRRIFLMRRSGGKIYAALNPEFKTLEESGYKKYSKK